MPQENTILRNEQVQLTARNDCLIGQKMLEDLGVAANMVGVAEEEAEDDYQGKTGSNWSPTASGDWPMARRAMEHPMEPPRPTANRRHSATVT